MNTQCQSSAPTHAHAVLQGLIATSNAQAAPTQDAPGATHAPSQHADPPQGACNLQQLFAARSGTLSRAPSGSVLNVELKGGISASKLGPAIPCGSTAALLRQTSAALMGGSATIQWSQSGHALPVAQGAEDSATMSDMAAEGMPGFKRPRSRESERSQSCGVFGGIMGNDCINVPRKQRSAQLWPEKSSAEVSTRRSSVSPENCAPVCAQPSMLAAESPFDERAIAGLLSLRAG